MKNKVLGVLILVAVIAAALVIYYGSGGGKPQMTLKGVIGGEKEGFFEDRQVKDIFKKKYGIVIDYSKAGSIDMVKSEGDNDFLFPSSQMALEIYKEKKGNELVKSEAIFNSPLVLYSWDVVTDALIKQGIVENRNGVYYVTDFTKMINWVIEGRKWSDIGLNDLYGSMKIISTDPVKSNSGNMFYALLANMLNNGEVVDKTTVENVIPGLQKFYKRLGYMEDSSSKLFDAYLTKGVGENPVIVGYENQIIEFATLYPDQWQSVKDKIRILYPVPTIWSSHTLISVKPKSDQLIKVLVDKDIQRIAWERHGFRAGTAGVANSSKSLQVTGITDKTDMVISMPRAEVVDRLLQALQAE